MAVKNVDVLKQIEDMLTGLKLSDKAVYDIVKEILKLVFLEYNTGRNQQIDKKIYDLIDAEATYKIKNIES